LFKHLLHQEHSRFHLASQQSTFLWLLVVVVVEKTHLVVVVVVGYVMSLDIQ
jgi:hypothetical protein